MDSQPPSGVRLIAMKCLQRLLDEMTVLRVSARRDERAPDDANRRRSDDGGTDRNQG